MKPGEYESLVGRQFGRLTVIALAERSLRTATRYGYRWRCRCACGVEIVSAAGNLRSGHSNSCGCLKREQARTRRKNLIGARVGRLTVIASGPPDERGWHQLWRVQCDCGVEKCISVSNLRSGRTHSCGCLSREVHAVKRREWTPTLCDDGTALIPLTRGLFAKIDQADIAAVLPYSWCAARRSNTTYAATSRGGHARYLHALLLPDAIEVDHINRDGLDNRRNNLRPATRQQNNANSGSRRGASSRFKGVHWNRERQRWIAQITANGTTHCLGSFTSEEAAARAYDAAARRLGGAYAFRNFPDEVAA